MRRILVWLALTLVCGMPAFAADPVFINEIHYDNVGTDAGEFIEVAGPAGTNLAGYSIELYNGAGGARYDSDPLSGIIPNQQNGFGTLSISYPVNGIQNGSPDGIALVNGSTVVQFLSYEGTFTATSHTANGMTSTDIRVSEDGSQPLGMALQLRGTGSTYADFFWIAIAVASMQNAVNTGQTFTGGTPTPTLSINNVSVAEGNSGTANAAFLISLSSPAGAGGVSFDIATEDGSASAGSDYEARSLMTLVIEQGSQALSLDVTVFGDTTNEPDEIFLVNVTNITGATNTSAQATATILNDDTPPEPATVFINEVDSDTPGTDVAEFVELYDGGAGNTSLNGLVVVFFNGGNDRAYAAFDLDGHTTNANGYFTLGNAAVPGVDRVFANGLLQNGEDAVAVYRANATDFATGTTGTPVTTNNLIDAVVYDTSDPDDPGLLVLLGAGQAQVDEDSGSNAANDSSQRCPDGGGGARNTSRYRQFAPTPDATNVCGGLNQAVARTISEIQGTGPASLFDDTAVITSGIVTARKSNGFFLQTPDAAVDADSNSSEGIFVFTSGLPSVAVGDSVSVLGLVDEFFNLTQIRALAADLTVLSTGNAHPAPVLLTTQILNANGTIDQLERLEGMRVQTGPLFSVAPTNGFGETFTVLSGVARPFREPGIEVSLPLPPGAPPTVPRFDQNPERLMIDSDGLFGSMPISVTSGVTFSSITGPLDFSFSDYKVLPDTPPSVSSNLSATPVPTPDSSELTVGSMNLLNFHNPSAERLAKASLAIRNVMRSPDIIGHEEAGDINGLQALAAKINADAVAAGQPNPNYTAYLIEADDDSEQDIDVGFLVKLSRVNVVSVTQEGRFATYINPLNNQAELLNDRPPLVLRATVARPGSNNALPVTVIVNHLRSLIDVEQDPGEGPRVREKRRKGAEFLAGLLQSVQGENVISVGDYNAFQFNDGYVDVMGTIKGTPAPADQVVLSSNDLVNPNLTNLVDTIDEEQQYSYVFEGNPQVLDHVIVNNSILARVTRFAYARNNADFPASFANIASRPERASDHDMPVAYFTLPAPAADLAVTKTAPSTAVTGADFTYTIAVTNDGPDHALAVKLSDGLPSNTTFRAITTPAGWTCITPAVGNTGTLSCTTDSLASGASASFSVAVTLACSTANGVTITNTATVQSTVNDPDSSNNTASATITASNPTPVISGASVDKTTIKPPNHKMVDITVSYSVGNNCGPVTTTLTVTSTEPVNSTGDGNSEVDWEVVDAHHVRLRAERDGSGNGRIYTIRITTTDSAGYSSSQSVTVSVPK